LEGRRQEDCGVSRLLKFLAVLILLAGCAKTVTWQEEVKLSDGRVIVVERETIRVSGGDELAHGGSGTTPKERRIRFEYPPGSGNQVEWRSAKMSSSLVPEIPLVLDIRQGEPVVLTSVATSEGCNRYLKYVFANAQWQEITLNEEFEAAPTNLLLMSGPTMPSFVDLTTKTKDIADIRYPRRLKQVGPHRTFCHG
jgi:hypothetical protein